jgi:dihydropteroate synthase
MPHFDCRGKLLDLSQPQVMGILNITPNSFSQVGRFLSLDEALKHAEQMVADGATLIDIGGEPTNPGVHPVVSLQQELDRVIPVVEALSKRLPVVLSVDTSKPEVMCEALKHGVGLINDVRALRQPGAVEVVAEFQVPVCLMHMEFPEGNAPDSLRAATYPQNPARSVGPKSAIQPTNSQRPAACPRDPAWSVGAKNTTQPTNTIPPLLEGSNTQEDILIHIKNFLLERVAVCVKAGIARDRILLDPGIGGGNFGKNLPQNLTILARLGELTALGFPLLIGVSRKLFVGELLNLPIEERLYGSLAAATVAVMNGASIIRAHDVKETVHAVKMAAAIRAEQCSPGKLMRSIRIGLTK